MRLKRIHVNQSKIRAHDPQPLLVKEHARDRSASEVEILDKDGRVVATVVYRPDRPLSCGAKVWIETRNEVRVS